ncbi:unnamed protein product [marine sediment metagenome]|uniref:Uncharacterized protein n=1 Tax=marine sediment metagenome TaxID=412755 RepID=X1BKE9_9ZZZZ
MSKTIKITTKSHRDLWFGSGGNKTTLEVPYEAMKNSLLIQEASLNTDLVQEFVLTEIDTDTLEKIVDCCINNDNVEWLTAFCNSLSPRSKLDIIKGAMYLKIQPLYTFMCTNFFTQHKILPPFK